MIAVLVAALAFVPVLGSRTAAQVTLTADQPAYEVTQLLTVTIQGPPGAQTFLFVDILGGAKTFPIGTIEIGFSPVWFVALLGPMPASGSMSVHEAFSCRTTNIYGNEIYLHAICASPGLKQFSNPLHFAEMKGDCTDECTDSVIELGLQVELQDVPPSGILWINAWKAGDTSQNYGPAFEIPIFDLAAMATGVLDVPLSNSSGSIVVSMLDLVGTSLHVRYFVNAQLAGYPSLEGATLFTMHYDGVSARGEITTDCTSPIKVGDEFGKFTVVKVVDGG
jgi:hypothetical protein